MLEISPQLLKKISVFGALNDGSLAFLLEQSNRMDAARGDLFFREGEDANAFFILEQGRAAVIKDWQGHQFLISELSEGDCFGEMALIEMQTRNASVLALEACRAIRLGFDSVFKLYKRDLQQFALLQMNLARELSRRLREANERLFEYPCEPRGTHAGAWLPRILTRLPLSNRRLERVFSERARETRHPCRTATLCAQSNQRASPGCLRLPMCQTTAAFAQRAAVDGTFLSSETFGSVSANRRS